MNDISFIDKLLMILTVNIDYMMVALAASVGGLSQELKSSKVLTLRAVISTCLNSAVWALIIYLYLQGKDTFDHLERAAIAIVSGVGSHRLIEFAFSIMDRKFGVNITIQPTVPPSSSAPDPAAEAKKVADEIIKTAGGS